jgi:hypothetical protein
MQRARSQLHLQLGQEVIYVLMTLGLMTALIMLANAERIRSPLPDCALPSGGCVESTRSVALPPECALPGRGPCYSPKDLPTCMLPGQGPCISAVDLPSCMLPEQGPCISAIDPSDCTLPGRRPCAQPAPQRPLILNLTEREGFRFATGSYVIDEQFMTKLRTVIAPAILKLGAEYQARVVEVVGHTDSVPMLSQQPSPERKPPSSSLAPGTAAPTTVSPPERKLSSSTLDRKLNDYLSGAGTSAEVVDNVGLGMMRAAAVVRALKELRDLQRGGFVFLAMSAGQTIGPDDRPIGAESGPLAGDEKRRRVEIRLRRSLHEP